MDAIMTQTALFAHIQNHFARETENGQHIIGAHQRPIGDDTARPIGG